MLYRFGVVSPGKSPSIKLLRLRLSAPSAFTPLAAARRLWHRSRLRGSVNAEAGGQKSSPATKYSGSTGVIMELNRRQLMGGALGFAASAVVSGRAARLVPAGHLQDARHAATPAVRFPGDPGSGRLYYGAAVMASLSVPDLERQLNGTLTVRRSYFSPGNTGGLISRAKEDHAAGRYPYISTKVPGTWAAVAAGAYDSWLHTLLQGLGQLSKPVMLGLHHEPEDEVGPPGMTAAAWVSMQNHAVAMAKSVAPNISIVPILMQWTFDPRSGRRPQDWLVSGAEVFGLDVYNDWSPGGKLPWLSFGQKASLALPYAGTKPIAIAEYGCHTDPSQPGRAAGWMRDAFTFASQHNIIAMAYYDSNLHANFGSWVLDAERIGAMRDCLHRSNVARLP